MSNLQRTFLYNSHLKLNAKMAPFGGYEMPIQYESIIQEHLQTRSGATMFDTCHMGEFSLSGQSIVEDLEQILSCDVASMNVGQCRYGLICNENGTCLDDQIIYRKGQNSFYMVVNASTKENDFTWTKSHLSPSNQIVNLSESTAKLDIQGPLSPKIVNSIVSAPLENLKYYWFTEGTFENETILISRTGYTGEIGFEIYISPQKIESLWDRCLEKGIKPAGLGARDTLRIEMGYPLYGHELSQNINAACSGFTKSISTQKNFIGSQKIKQEMENQNGFILSGITFESRRTAHEGDIVLDQEGKEIGKITSGSFSPSLQKAIAIAYIKKGSLKNTAQVIVKTARADINGQISTMPFLISSTARKNITNYL